MLFLGKERIGGLESEIRAALVRKSKLNARLTASRAYGINQDKLIPVNPSRVPELDEEQLKKYPSGYRYLAYCQEKTMGVKVLLDMPGHRRENGVPGGSVACGKKHDLLYWQCKQWLDGEELDI